MTDLYIKLTDLESYILADVQNKFKEDGFLNTFDFFCIIIWKANRAKSKTASRLLTYNSKLEITIYKLTSEIYSAKTDKDKLEILIKDYEFRLPTASAILSLLYPENFTVYDIRVCETLTDFHGIAETKNFEKLWKNYQDYIKTVRDYNPQIISLRDKDKLLWGKSFYEQLNRDIESNFTNESKNVN